MSSIPANAQASSLYRQSYANLEDNSYIQHAGSDDIDSFHREQPATLSMDSLPRRQPCHAGTTCDRLARRSTGQMPRVRQRTNRPRERRACQDVTSGPKPRSTLAVQFGDYLAGVLHDLSLLDVTCWIQLQTI
ncbi:uncharacterized protein BO80DRAFT_277064 [Aspergillus ibericus CBS 121593]|uniref:Uncharacterized protein n=1 Tax=Aspergillus ibericus CBS 121593 TaxID=1448316 RepID=A0A395GIB1_9EURO|nr:hypothetical protein BO80DRAFT_277064 [Aspergillus ibericus CBS 121593]RAK95175.1 hypothetical protein BO80DRAFT_277064 [Aspergillus ibericus CBS 121593]